MKYIELKYRGKSFTKRNEIDDILEKEQFYWLIDAEVENAVIEILNGTIIWHDGVFYSGNWHYGIFKNGKFFGNWENGIWENGNFSGTGRRE